MAWLSGYSYRKQITFTGSTGAGTGYQIPLEVHFEPGTDGNGVVYLGGHSQNFPNDIRFTDDDGTTLLDHWLQERVEANGAWCWFQGPRAIRYLSTYDKTYFGTVTQAGDVQINSYNHNTGELASFTLKAALQVDDHASPAILVRNDGKLIVFYSAHNGSTIYYRISTNAEDISAWDSEQSIAPQASHSYPIAVQLSGESNKIYLFFRGGPSGYVNRWYYVTSTDGGINWSSATLLFEQGTSAQHQYLKITSDANKIYFTHSGHPVNETTSIYFFYYYNGAYYKDDGTEIVSGLPLGRDDISLVYDATAGGNYKAWIWDIVVSAGTYYIVFAHFASDTDHRYDYARWTGSAWDVHEITTAGTYIDGAGQQYYSGGISLDPEDPDTVYLSRQISSQWEIQKWVTPDGGTSWDDPVNITSSSSSKNVRPVVVKNHAPEIIVLWMYGTYTSYTNYDTVIKGAYGPAKFWIEIQDDLGSNQSFYIYYGKAGEGSGSNGDNTFIVFDDFPGSSLDTNKWDLKQGAFEVSGGVLQMRGTAGTRGLIESKTSFAYAKALEIRGRALSANTANVHFCAMREPSDWNDRGGDWAGFTNATKTKYYTYDNGASTASNVTVVTNTGWYRYKIIWESAQSRGFQDDTLKVTHNTNIPLENQVVVFYEGDAAGRDWDIDWVFVRKYVSPEPAYSSTGSEEEPGVPPGWNQLQYTSEPPTPNAWNQIKQDAGTGWKKLLYEGE